MIGDRDSDRAVRYGYRLLAARQLSEKEFRTKLAGKGFSRAIVEPVVARFRELGYLDDRSFAVQAARSLALSKLWGNRRIAFRLQEKGIGRDLIHDALSEVREEMSERDAIRALLSRASSGRDQAKNGAELRKLFRRLLGRGFPAGLISDILSIRGEEVVDDRE